MREVEFPKYRYFLKLVAVISQTEIISFLSRLVIVVVLQFREETNLKALTVGSSTECFKTFI